MELLDPGRRQRRGARAPARKLDEQAAGAGDSRYAQALRDDDGVQRLVAGRLAAAVVGELSLRLRRSGQGDDAGTRRAARASVGAALRADDAATPTQSLQIISPYFVPGDAGSAGLIDAREGGRERAGAHQFPGRQRRRRGARRLLAPPQGAARRRRAALGAQAAVRRKRPSRASPARRARACTPRRSRSTARRCSSAATTSIRARPGSTASRACWSRTRRWPRSSAGSSDWQTAGSAPGT